jgi:hypothetical protein
MADKYTARYLAKSGNGKCGVVLVEDYVADVRKYGSHVEGCNWQVFPPGSRDCDCGFHDIVGVPDFASDAATDGTAK